MRKALILFNSLAADGRSKALLAGSSTLASDFELIRCPVQSEAELTSALETVDPANTQAIVVFGGDGTVNRCLRRIMNCPVPVAMFPAGTVNDFALELGMTTRWEELRTLLLHGKCRPHPVVEVNGAPFLVYGTIGLGAQTSARIQRTRGTLKWFRQVFPVVQTPLFTASTIFFTNDYRKHLRLTLDGVTHEVHTPGIYIVNQRWVNRRIDLDWDPAADRRRFRIVAFKPLNRTGLFNAVVKFNKHSHLKAIRPFVDVFDVERAEIESIDSSPILFVADGEPVAEAPLLRITRTRQPLMVYRRDDKRP